MPAYSGLCFQPCRFARFLRLALFFLPTLLWGQTTYPFKVTPVGPGTVQWTPVKANYNDGDVVQVTIVPNAGAFLDYVEGYDIASGVTFRTTESSFPVTINAQTKGEWFAWFNEGQVFWRENFESSESVFEWSATRGVWEVATIHPNHGPKRAFEGLKCAATDGDADYPDGVSTTFRKFTPITLPSIQPGETLRISFWEYFQLVDDNCTIRYRPVGTPDWITFDTIPQGSSAVWTKRHIVLDAFAGKEIELEFQLNSDSSFRGPGYFFDNLVLYIAKIPQLITENFEYGTGLWHMKGGQWEIGIPVSSVGPYSGRMVAATVLSGNYVDGAFSELVSPPFVLDPALDRPRLAFNHWFSNSDDYGQIFLMVLNDPTVYPIGDRIVGSSPWTRNQIEISQFGGQSVKLVFRFASDSSFTALGWYIDDVSIFPGKKTAFSYTSYYPEASYATFFDQVELKWKDVYTTQFLTTYDIYRGLSSSQPSSELVASGLRAPLFRDTTAKIGQQYFYWVQTIRDGAPAGFTTWASGLREVGAPESLEASQGSFTDRIRLTWSRVGGVTGYSLYRNTSNNSATALLVQSGVAGNRFDDFAVDSGKNYYYWIKSQAADRISQFSAAAVGYRTEGSLNSVSATDGLFAEKIRVTWTSLLGAENYDLYRHTQRDPTKATKIGAALTSLVYDDTTAQSGTVYYYWVKALRPTGYTDFSNVDAGYRRLQRQTNLVAWGDNDFGQSNLPNQDLTNIVGLAAGVDHSLALRSNGTVVGWGRNLHGQAEPPANLTNVIDIAVGFDHSLALRKDGSIVAWGRSLFGKTAVPEGLPPVIDVAAGSDHNLALLANGTVIAWGSNDFGQSDVPPGLNNVVEIAAGGFHSMARRVDGSIVVWGDNEFGQLNVPLSVQKALRIAAGWNHSLVILPDRSIKAWGDDSEGQTSVPPSVGQRPSVEPRKPGLKPQDSTVANVVSIDAGLFHSLALLADGSLVSWGSNSSSQTSTPGDLTSASNIEAGESHNLAIKGQPDPVVLGVTPAFAESFPGSTVVFRGRAVGGADLHFQWYKDGQPLSGQTGESLVLSNLGGDHQGAYLFKALSGGKEAQSAPVSLVVQGAPVLNVSPLSFNFDSKEQSGSIAVTSNTTWQASKVTSWVEFTGVTQGNGNGTVSFKVSPNLETSSRSTTITIGSKTISINQGPGPGFTQVNPTSLAVNYVASTASFTITSNQPWSATSNVDWITFTTAASGSGNGSLGISIQLNSTAQTRQATISIGSANISVTQGPTGYVNTDIKSVQLPAAGGSGPISISANIAWSFTSISPWIEIVSGASGNGNGQLTYRVGANSSSSPRSGQIQGGDDDIITISQAGALPDLTLSRLDGTAPGQRPALFDSSHQMVVLALKAEAGANGVHLESIRLLASGSAFDPMVFEEISLFKDSDGNASFSPTDTQLSSKHRFVSDNGFVVFRPNLTIPALGSEKIFVVSKNTNLYGQGTNFAFEIKDAQSISAKLQGANPTTVTPGGAFPIRSDLFSIQIEETPGKVLFDVILTSSPGGQVFGGGKFPAGSETRLLAKPALGFHFKGWTGDLASILNPHSLTVSRNVNIHAEFEAARDIFSKNSDYIAVGHFRWVPGFGVVWVEHYPWVLHYDMELNIPALGWIYIYSQSPDSIWMHLQNVGWAWTQPEFFPYLYLLDEEGGPYHPAIFTFDPEQRQKWFYDYFKQIWLGPYPVLQGN